MDIEAAGAAVTGGLVAGAIERPTGKAGEEYHGRCSDCGAEASGAFCSTCGQPTHVHRTLLHLGEEILHGVMHFDGRIWRTLPLLALNPGKLTREWVQGMRTRYVSPLAIFLFTLFVMFFALSFMPQPGAHTISTMSSQAAQNELAAEREALVEAQKSVAALRAENQNQQNAASQAALAAAEKTVADSIANLDKLEVEMRDGRADGLQPGSWQAQLKDMASSGKAKGEGLGGVLLKKLQNPDLALYKLQQTIYKFAFLLVPFSIPFVAVLFLWKRGFTLYDHGVFVLYSLTFMAILLMVLVVAGTLNVILGGWAVFLATLIVPAHMFFQLKGAYSLSIFS
ncbi:hypothetical protein LTR94_026636, partial [Friedmanniomyces endolithicus]